VNDDPRRRSLSRPGLRRRLLERIRRPRNAPTPRPTSPPLEPAGEVVCAAFHTLARDTRFSGHLQMSRFAGQLQQLGVPHALYVLLMRPEDEARNLDTVERFVAAVRQRRPAFVVLYAAWLPWLADRLRDECGVRVVTLDRAGVGDVPARLAGLEPQVAVAAAAAGAVTPEQAARATAGLEADDVALGLDYELVGADGPLPQTLAYLRVQACHQGPPIADNRCFADLELPPGTSARACSYCNAARDEHGWSHDERMRRLGDQVRYLQQHLPDLAEIAVPFPEDYLAALAELIRSAGERGLRPVVFSGQFNAAALVQGEGDLDDLLVAAAAHEFGFHVNVVGLESFEARDLARFNRGDPDQVRAALDVLRRLREHHPPASFMPATVGSLIPFHPWQDLSGLRTTVDVAEDQQLPELFHGINVNDVRFHPGVPLYHLAARDGLLAEVEDEAIPGLPLGGYFAERPWHFADPEVARLHRLFEALAGRATDRLGLLEACLRLAEQGRSADPRRVVRGLDRLAARMDQHRLPRTGAQRLLRLGGPANTGHPRPLFPSGDHPDTLVGALEAARALPDPVGARVTLAGPEPTLLPWLPELVAKLRAWRARDVDVLTYGRVLAYPAHVARMAAAGPLQVSLLLHDTDADAHDRVVRVPGAFAQATSGLRELARLGRGQEHTATVAVVAALDARGVGRLAAFAPLARDLGATELRLLVRTGDLPLDRLDALVADADLALDAAGRAGLAAGFECATGPIWVEPPLV